MILSGILAATLVDYLAYGPFRAIGAIAVIVAKLNVGRREGRWLGAGWQVGKYAIDHAR